MLRKVLCLSTKGNKKFNLKNVFLYYSDSITDALNVIKVKKFNMILEYLCLNITLLQGS